MPNGGATVVYTNAASAKTITADGSVVLTFENASDAASFTLPGATKAEILAIGGGGGGGGRHRTAGTAKAGGAGGGAGGLVDTNLIFSSGTYVVSVGKGGAAAGNVYNANPLPGTDGDETTIKTNGVDVIRAFGGGGGGGQSPGNNGGSGGGGAMNTKSEGQDPGVQSPDAKAWGNLGFAGGAGDAADFGGGGGGAGGAGKKASEGGAGGAGYESAITGDPVTYAVGGGGGNKATTTDGATADTYGSGGGGAGRNTAKTAADGKPGVVIVRIFAAVDKPLEKPQDSQHRADGTTTYSALEENPFYTRSGQYEDVKDPGIYTATATPVSGVTWTDGSSDPVTVTMVIYGKDSKAGTEYFGELPISFVGAITNYWLYNETTKTNDLILGYDVSSVGTYALPGSTVARVLAVGGGGGGGGRHRTDKTAKAGGGGGGAGGLVDTNLIFSSGTYVVSVGKGGAAAGNVYNANPLPGTDGGATTIATNCVTILKAFGGGGGGGQSPGNNGGSGGGGAMNTSGEGQDPGVQSPDAKAWGNLGFAGGVGDAADFGGGGGGAGGVGKKASEGGVGGAGYESAITGDPVTYAVGGGGGNNVTKTDGATADAYGSGGGGAGRNTAKTAADGKPGVIYIRISAVMKGEFKKPEPTKEYTYDREEHRAIEPSPFYTISGDNVGTDAGEYVATAKLLPGVSWPEGGTEDVEVTMFITPREAVFSELYVTNWEYLAEKTPEPSCKVDPEWVEAIYQWRSKVEGEGEQWNDWSSGKPVKVGEYDLRVGAPTNGNFTFEYAYTNFFITKIHAEIRNLRQRSWMAGDPKPPEPTYTVTPDWATNYMGFAYAPRVGDDAVEVTDWSREKPTEPGHYWIRAEILATDSFDCEPAYAEFDILSGLGGIFTDYVEITVGSHSPDLTNFPWRVSLSEEEPIGFLYSRAGEDGNDMTFTDNTGTNALPYIVNDWDTNDVSHVYVRIPVVSNGVQTIRLYWHARDRSLVPDHHPEQVWESWGSPEDEAWKSAWQGATKPAKPFSLVSRDGYLVNYWVHPLELTKEFWTVEEGKAGKGGKIKEPFPEAAFDDGKVRHCFTNLLSRTGYDEMPVDIPGSFRVIYWLDDPDGKYEPLETHADYAVSGSTTWDDLKGSAKTLTLSGRVMLANDDLFGGTDRDALHAVTDQSYWQTRFVDRGDGTVMTNDVFWTHEAESGTGDPNLDKWTTDLQTNSVHQLHFMGDGGKTNTLWRFDNIRIGVDGYGNNKNGHYYLPWSSTSLAISSFDAYLKSMTEPSQRGRFREVGNIVMRNIYAGEDDESQWSVVYSPCYTNGIGTIYFDAVNCQYNNLDCYKLVVEVATGDDTTDEAADGPNPNGGHVGLGRLGKNRWKRYPILPLLHKGVGSAFTSLAETTELKLEIADISSSALDQVNNFYRLCVKVNCHDPCRFRIRRTAAVNATTVKPDESRFIILDNILVSYPNMSADLFPFGEYDNKRAGKQILGQAGAMTVPFPAAGQDGVLARAQAYTHVNDFVPGVTPESVVIRAQMMYRWRYLDQAYEPEDESWRPVELWPADGLKAREPLEIPSDEGDLEFWYRADVNSPGYDYFDYSGAELYLKDKNGKPLYVDQQSAVTNRIDLGRYVSRAGETLPSAGTDWFIRLRAGRSDFEGVRVITRQGGVVETNEMEVVADGTWRACVKTPKDVGTIAYRFEGMNRQTAGSDAYAKNVAHWCAKADLDEIPNTIALDTAARADDWAEAPCDAKTGYIMFRLDEAKESVYVARADWQDFNRWVTAVNEKFVGSQTDTNSTTYVAKQIPIDWSRTEPSIGTNSNWSEDFSVGSGQDARIIYPRNVPFDEARSVNGWTAHNGMWTYGRYAIETELGLGDATALQLEGRGRGSAEMISATSIPEGIDTVLYTARVAQFNEFENFVYWNGALAKKTPIMSMDDIVFASDLSDVSFATTALLTEKGLGAFSGDGSVSLVANWHQQNGGYEFRVSLGRSTGDLRLELYRWTGETGAMKATCLGTNFVTGAAQYLIKDYPDDALATAAKMGGLFISTKNDTAGGVIVHAGVRLGEVNQGEAAKLLSKDNTFATVAYWDTSAASANLKKGSVGVLTRNCPGVFENPVLFLSPVVKKPSSANTIVGKASESGFALSSDSAQNLLSGTTAYGTWILKPGRMERISSARLHTGHFGFQAIRDVKQAVVVQTTDHGANKWSTVATNDVSGFRDQVFTNIVRSVKPSDVRIKVLGSVSDPRKDVVLGGIEMTQWVGQWTRDWDNASYYGLTNEWVYTSAWVNEYVEGGNTSRTVTLQPARTTSASSPVSLRSPLMRGFGLLHFAWRNADPNAVLRVQAARTADRNNLISLTKAAPDYTGEGRGYWQNVGEPIALTKPEGEMTVYLNERYPVAGALRLVVDKAVATAALADTRNHPEYGMVEITDIYAWDLPAYDMHSWIGWNFRAQGWDGTVPGAWANLSDGGAEHGLSGLLNNTLDPATLAEGDATDYKTKLPHVQSPTFGTNAIGAVDFRARLYGKNDLTTYRTNAIVTIYGATTLSPMGLEPTGWTKVADFAVSNGFYRTFTQRFKPSEQFYAIRFAVRGMRGYERESGEPSDEEMAPPMPLRVAIDDICIYERPPLALHFRKLFVRPFRDAEAMKGVEKVRDIDSVNEQPLIGEAFGFQAEVEVESDEILIDDPKKPLTVDLWYYPKAEPWGYSNWKDRSDAVHVTLEKAVGEKLVFRSTVDNGLSICPMQDLEEGKGYKLVQYEMVASYWDKSGDYHEDGCELSAKDWSMPEWNSGFADPNEVPGASFSAFTVLEEIAPKRAWINEVNYCDDPRDAAKKDQWVELAVPSGVDMTGWSLKLYDMDGNFVENLVTLGRNKAPKEKTDPLEPSHYAFYVVKSPQSTLAADWTWPKVDKNRFTAGALDRTMPYGFELVRPTGVVEHRAVVQGWNQMREEGYRDAWKYDGTNLVRVLNAKTGTSDWVWAGEDYYMYPGATVGVTNGYGSVGRDRTPSDWYSPLGRTPGAKNQGQYIDPNWFVYPNGGYYRVIASVIGAHMRQIVGGETNKYARLTVQEGATTNIEYEVDRWYEIGSCEVKPGGGAVPVQTRVENRKTYYTLTLENISSQTEVTVDDTISGKLVEAGLDDTNPYKNAVMRWLETNGDEFAGDEIVAGEFRGYDGTLHLPLDLTHLYWLDLDPTLGGWELWGGMGEKGGTQHLGPVISSTNRVNASGLVHTNVLTTCWLMITNANDAAFAAYPPRRLQGLANEQSDDPEFSGSWTSVTFKITMQMANESGSLVSKYHPMRQFVFDSGSFRGADDPEAPFAARIEITDPFSRQSPAWEWGWWKYSGQGISPFTSFRIGTDINPSGVSTLKKDDLLTW